MSEHANALPFRHPLAKITRLLLLAPALAQVACGSSDTPITIGITGPFSEQLGLAMRRGAELAVSEINAQGGVLGRPLELRAIDDSGRAPTALRVARRLYDDEAVVAVIGHLSTATSLAAASTYSGGTNPLVAMSPAASSPEMSHAGPYIFRVCPDDLVHARQLAEWARSRLGARTAMILYENDTRGRAMRVAFRTRFTQQGGQIVAEDPYSLALPSFEPYLSRVAIRGGTDAILVAGAATHADRIVATLDTTGLRTALLGGSGLLSLTGAEGDVDSVFVSLAYLPDTPRRSNETFVAAFSRAHGGQPPNHTAAAGYDIVHLFARAIGSGGIDRQRVREYLAGIGTQTEPFEGVTGTITFNANGDLRRRDTRIGTIRRGRIVAASEPTP